MSLANAFAIPNERTRSESQSIAPELQNDVIALIGLNPKRVCRVICNAITLKRPEVENLALYRRPGRIGTERIDPDENLMGLTLQNPTIYEIDSDNLPIRGAYHTERC